MWTQVAADSFPGSGFRDPARESVLAEAESRLGDELPAELTELLLESNGIVGRTGVDTVWTVERIVERNLHLRADASIAQLYMPFDALLFFGDNGGGDQFAFVRTPRRPDIFAWDHESDSRSWVARDLRDYLGRSLAAGGDDWYR
ncbi:SMI1/KNR4 family protein [Streptomyces sp. CBMA123]|uniref:SMI1/KNR4 family protein n=1 Tax=Streptomyces sp. CBMA123 TaxID=1896313 RepID=UPI001661C0BF|nr:SMI1/KNR4 family protein [Streptomyces sp. CBMA123]MBD0689093.1 cell wall assembly/cell proliferation coordinating protein, KNR4 [Streptomyces sp. CBMA123]